MPAFAGEPGQRIAYRHFPHPQGAPTVVLIHGFASSSAIFTPAIPVLRERFSVLTVDLLGHGGSDAPAVLSLYSPQQSMTRLLALLDSLGISRPALFCGHAMGGALALRLALAHPTRVAGVVVVSSTTATADASWRRRMQPRMDELAERVASEGPGFLRQSRLYPGRNRTLPAALRAALIADFDRLDGNGLAGTAAALVVEVNRPEQLGDVTAPTLIVTGERTADGDADPEVLAKLLKHGRTRTVVIGDSGFAVPAEQPEAFSEAVVAFAEQARYIPRPGFAKRHRAGVITTVGSVITAVVAGIGAVIILQTQDGGGGTPTPIVDETPTETPGTGTSAAATETPIATQTAGG